VDACRHPRAEWDVPDHGELCWLPWDVRREGDALVCTVRSRALPLVFDRRMRFGADSLSWEFRAENQGPDDISFQHVMHALMPPTEIESIDLPAFASAYDEAARRDAGLADPAQAARALFAQTPGTARMLLLRGVAAGRLELAFRCGLRIEIRFPRERFPTLGIWWNRGGYPDEDGCGREECAFEPIPGNTSSLGDAFRDGTCLSVSAGRTLAWTVEWRASIARGESVLDLLRFG
jgi:hypothetical protein